MTIIKKIVLISHVLIMGLVCCSNDPISSRNENKGGSVSINLVATSGSIFSSLARSSEAKVTAVGMDTIRQSLTVSSNSITGLISNIPAGFNRKFEVFVYDSLGRICYYGSAYSNIINGSTVNVPLTLYRYTGTGNAVIDGSIIDSIPSNPNQSPSVTITSPANNATFLQGDTILINATATDSDGIIRNVTFYNDSILLATDTIAPYGYTLRNISSGTYRFRAVALDSNGATGTSSIITVSVTATSALLTGTTFGTSPSWSTGSEYDKAFDKNTATFFDFSSADTGYTGLDLSSPKTTNKIRYYPRANFANRMVGGKFQGSNTSRTSGYVDLLTISIQPTAGAWTEATISDTTKYRYIRYKSPNGGFGNIAEIEIWGY
jgi:hypothetical protein